MFTDDMIYDSLFINFCCCTWFNWVLSNSSYYPCFVRYLFIITGHFTVSYGFPRAEIDRTLKHDNSSL